MLLAEFLTISGGTVNTRAVLIALVCLLLPAVSFSQTFTYTSLTYPGAYVTFANGINASGEIVGAYQTDTTCNPQYLPVPNCTTHGFTYFNGSYSSYDAPDSISTYITGVNDYGDIVGIYTSSDNNVHGFLLEHNGSFQTLDQQNQQSLTTVPMGVNKSLTVAGMLYGAQNPHSGFVWTKGNFSVTSPSFDGGYRGIANNGAVVGQIFLHDFWKGYLKSASDKDVFAFHSDTYFSGVNNRGDIVRVTGANSYFVAHVEANEGGTDKEVTPKYVSVAFPGAGFTKANAINANDAIVGDWNYTVGGCACGFLATRQ